MILFDANILVHAHATSSPLHDVARRLRDQAAKGELEACLSPQVLCEFFAVSTNPKFFQPALTPQQASGEIDAYWSRSAFKRIVPRDSTIRTLLALLRRARVSGQDVFDVFLVATMLDNDIRTIYTQNTKDFEIYHELRVINPLTA
ncbi:MAG: PIN domain-containing protein [Candidatus Omnitrophica bacterium]|nr:PIN domain-containing protein [Candidatus Omnitrophota bacterium]